MTQTYCFNHFVPAVKAKPLTPYGLDFQIVGFRANESQIRFGSIRSLVEARTIAQRCVEREHCKHVEISVDFSAKDYMPTTLYRIVIELWTPETMPVDDLTLQEEAIRPFPTEPAGMYGRPMNYHEIFQALDLDPIAAEELRRQYKAEVEK